MIGEPPIGFDHAFPGVVQEVIMRAPDVDAFCRARPGMSERAGQIIGCQFFEGGKCVIVLSKHAVPFLRRHETAHCNGWRHGE